MNKKKNIYGSKEWFENKFQITGTGSFISYFNYEKDTFQILRHSNISKEIKKLNLNFKKKSYLMDIGCGTGHLTKILSVSAKIDKTIGVDFSEILLNYAKKKFPKIKFLLGNLPYKLPKKNKNYDVVSVIETLYYIKKSQRQIALKNILKYVKKKGIFIFASNITGNQYLSIKEINILFKKLNLSEEKRIYENYTLIIITQRFLKNILKLCEVLKSKDVFIKKSFIKTILLKVLKNPVGILLFGLLSKISMFILSSKRLTMFLYKLESKFKFFGPSHLLIIAKKK